MNGITSDMIWMFLSLVALIGAIPAVILIDVWRHPAPTPPKFQVLHPVQD